MTFDFKTIDKNYMGVLAGEQIEELMLAGKILHSDVRFIKGIGLEIRCSSRFMSPNKDEYSEPDLFHIKSNDRPQVALIKQDRFVLKALHSVMISTKEYFELPLNVSASFQISVKNANNGLSCNHTGIVLFGGNRGKNVTIMVNNTNVNTDAELCDGALIGLLTFTKHPPITDRFAYDRFINN